MPSPEPADVIGALLSPVLVFLCVVLAWRGLSRMRDPRRQDLSLLPWALVLAIAWHPSVVQGLLRARDGDSLSALTPAARAGAIALIVVAALVPFALSVAKTRALRNRYPRGTMPAPAALDVVASALLALVFLALALPVFRAGYHRLAPEMPAHRVVEGTPSVVERLGALARPGPQGSLADHAAALFLWTLVLACLLGWLLDVRQRRRSLGAVQAGTALAALAACWSFATLALG